MSPNLKNKKEIIEEFERKYIIFERPDYIRVRDILIQDIKGDYWRPQEINPKEAITFLYKILCH